MAQLLPVDPFDLVIFGGSGDLALRKLMPALWHRHCDGQFSDDSRIIAIGRSPIPREEYVAQLNEALTGGAGKPPAGDNWSSFIHRVEYVWLDALAPETWDPLTRTLEGREGVIRAFYLAMPPALFGSVARHIRDRGLKTEDMRIVLEKPVGNDFDSAQQINDQVGACFDENQIFRIDHYLGKETVQNLLALR